MRPLIGITASFSPHIKVTEFDGEHRYDHQYLYHSYVRAVEMAGGIPLIIPVGTESEVSLEALNRLNGLLLAGGVDIGPNRYHMPPGPGLSRIDSSKDETELTLARAAVEKGIPLFGICRGIQILAVALGGKLVQDIRTEIGEKVRHTFPENDPDALHEINIEDDSILHSVMATSRATVNSWHHQAVMEAPKNWRVTARSDDGLIEAMEPGTGEMGIGVQWHPEMMIHNDEGQLGLFRAFIDACNKPK